MDDWMAMRKLATTGWIDEHFEEVDMNERGMELVRVRRSDVVRKVKEAREKHWQEFGKVNAKFLDAATREMGKRIERAKAGNTINLQFSLPVPQDHTKDYDRVLAMLDMSVDDVVELTKREFQRFVLNDWEWGQEWENIKTSYGVGEAE